MKAISGVGDECSHFSNEVLLSAEKNEFSKKLHTKFFTIPKNTFEQYKLTGKLRISKLSWNQSLIILMLVKTNKHTNNLKKKINKHQNTTQPQKQQRNKTQKTNEKTKQKTAPNLGYLRAGSWACAACRRSPRHRCR